MSASASVLTEGDNGKTAETRVGAILIVRLHESASNGYTWSPQTMDSAISVLDKPTYSRRSETLGGSSDVEWKLSANKAGTFQIAFRLWRSWEGDRSVQRRFEVTLLAKP